MKTPSALRRPQTLQLAACAFAGALLLSPPLQAAPLFSDNFESPSAALGPVNPDPLKWNVTENGGGDVFLAVDNGTVFTTPNQYMSVTASGGGGSNNSSASVISSFSDAVLTISFDFNEPTTGGGSDFSLQVGRNGFNNFNKFAQITFDDGTLRNSGNAQVGNYTLALSNHVDILLNGTTSSVSYLGGTQSLAANTYDVWLNGTRIANGAANFGSATSGDFNFFNLTTAGSNVFNVDNFVIDSELTVVPEPSTFALLIGAGVVGIGFMRRRRR